jgi:hypothetical protein
VRCVGPPTSGAAGGTAAPTALTVLPDLEAEMSLRPHEQRILADVEEQLIRDDPALADLLARHPPTTARRNCARPSALSLTRRSAASMGPSIGLIVAAIIVALVVGGMQIAMLVLAVVLLGAAHVLRWRARHALFQRIRGRDTDA